MDVFGCSKCSKKLRTRVGIIRHVRKCGDNRKIADPLKNRYPCNHCHKEFLSQWGLSKHMKKNHSTGNLIPKEVTKHLKCNYCSAMFSSKQGRINHAKKNHPEYNIKMNELSTRKTHDCIFCGKTFSTKRYRNRHEDTCVKKLESVASSRGNNPSQTAEEILTCDETSFLQQDISASNDIQTVQDEQTATNTMPFEIQDTTYSLETPQFSSNAEDSLRGTSSAEINMTPKLKRYVRDRKPFLKLRTPDVNSPRRSRLNLEYGQQTVIQYQKQVNALQQQIRRLQKQVEMFKNLLKPWKSKIKFRKQTSTASEGRTP